MKNSIKLSLIFVLLASLLTSCVDEVDNPYLTVSPEELIQVNNEGGTSEVTVATNLDDWTYKIMNGEWISVEESSSGLILKAETNQSAERRAILHISSLKYPVANKTMSIIQGGTYMKISPEVFDIPGVGAEMDITVTTSVSDWAFSLENGAWLNVVKTETGLRLKAPVNSTPRTRTATLSITSAMFPVVNRDIQINQITGVVLEADPAVVALPSGGGESVVSITTNVDDWGYRLSESWLTAEKTGSGVKLKANANPGLITLSAVLTVYSTAFPDDIWKEVQVSQFSSLIFEDHFDWLGAGASVAMYTGTGEKRFDAWLASYGTLNGWSSTPSADAGGAVQPYVYSRAGYAKFGKTKVGCDMITPKLAAIDGTKELVVSFKAVAYMPASGSGFDENEFNIEVIGPGSISQILSVGSQRGTPDGRQPSSGKLTAGGCQFVIGNFNNPDGPTRPNWLGADYDPWAPEYAERSFVVTGATAETQIRFIGGPNIGVTAVSYRFGLDDVKIVLK